MKGVVISALVMVAMIQLMFGAGEAFTCQQIDAQLSQCLPYLKNGGEPSPACCKGVKAIQDIAQTVDDKRQACSCLKVAANSFPDLKDDYAKDLPTRCNVALDIDISRNTDCSRIH